MSTVGGYLSNTFGKSPFQAVQIHMSLCIEASEMTLELLADFADISERVAHRIQMMLAK